MIDGEYKVRRIRLSAVLLAILIFTSIAQPSVLAAGTADVQDDAVTSSSAENVDFEGSDYSGIIVGAATPEATPKPDNTFSNDEGFVCEKLTDPNSESIFMISLDTNTVVYTLNPDERRPMASLTKIMSYVVAAEVVDDLKNTKTVVPESVAEELEGTGSSLAEIKTGEKFSIYELLNLMMVPSGNDAALTIAKYVDSLSIAAESGDAIYDENGDGIMSFVELMNKKAAEIGCRDTHFVNAHGLYDPNHYSTAREMAMISQYALGLPYFAEITSQQSYIQPPTNLTENEREVITSNRMLLSYMDEYYTYANGIKTGSLNESGYCISATGLYDGYSYLVVCMGSPYIDEYGVRTYYHGEMYDAATLLRWAFLEIENKTIVADGDLIGEVDLKYSWGKDSIQVLAKGNVMAMMPKKLEDGDIQILIDLPDNVKAPISKGDEIGTATYIYKGEVIAKIPLVAAEGVERSEVVQTIEQGQDIISSPWFIVTAAIIAVLTVVYIVLVITINRRRSKMRRIKKYRDL